MSKMGNEALTKYNTVKIEIETELNKL